MSCSNCFNGCTEIVSDQCVKYTGIDVPVLGIKTGDSLSYVEQALIEFLTSTLDGTGIKVDIDPQIICELVQNYLPTCGDLTVVDLFNALIKAVCDLQAQIVVINGTLVNIQNQIDVIEANYTIGCLDEVTPTSGTHDILQAVITKLCAFILDVETNYVQLADLDALIQAYLDSISSSTLIANKMVPYTAVEFYPTPAIMLNFDLTGAGTGNWANIYLCNGLNGTPDKRGRVPVGATTGMGGGPLNPAVDPTASPFNPTYALGAVAGSNSIQLTTTQIPPHSHATTVTLTDPGHFTSIKVSPSVYTTWDRSSGSATPITNIENVTTSPAGAAQTATTTIKAYTGITLDVINPSTGGGDFHANNQPALACYYIMYIP